MEHNPLPDNYKEFAGYVKNKAHYLPLRVYYADTDFSGVVHHSRYMEFMERGRTEALRAFGLVRNITETAKETAAEPLLFTVSKLSINFKAPAHIDDIVLVETKIEKLTGARLFTRHHIFKGKQVLTDSECCLVLITAKGRPRRIPDSWRVLFA